MSFFCMFLLRIFFHGPTMVGTKLYFHLAVMMWALNYIFPVFFLRKAIFLWQKDKIGFHSKESYASFFFLPLLMVWVHHWLRKLIHDRLHLITHHRQLEKCPKWVLERGIIWITPRIQKWSGPLFSLSKEEERKKKTSIKLCGTQSFCKAKRWKNQRKKASAKVMEPP